MAISEPYAGSQTATINTEHVLNTTTPETTDGVYQVFVDCDAMAVGDAVEIRIKEKVQSTGTQRTLIVGTFAHDPSADDPVWVSPTFLLLHGWDVTLKQTAGTGRAFPWSIRKVA